MKELLEKITNGIIDLAIKLVIALIVIYIGFKLVKVLERYILKKKSKNIDESAKGFLVSFISIALKSLVIVIAISILGVPSASIIAVVSSCGLAIGLALQGGLSNIAGGVMILIFKPFKVGDYISTHEDEGTVSNISMFYTTLKTVDNKLIMLTNGALTNTNIINYTTSKTRRVDLEISVSYSSNIDKVKKIVNDIIEKHDLILKDEEKVVRVIKHDASAIVFTVRVWVKTDDYWPVKFDLLEQIKTSFDKNKIEIPFNQIDVHMKK